MGSVRKWMRATAVLVILALGSIAAADAQAPSRVRIRLGFASVAHMEHVPALLVGERLRARGIDLEPVFFAQEVLSIEATIRGDTDLGTGASIGTMGAIQKGAALKFFLTESRNPWTLTSKKELARCEDLNGKRMALHSEAGISTAMTRAWLKQNCPNATPTFLIVPGSERRAAALLANQIDITPLEIGDSIGVDHVRPGAFRRFADFGKEWPWLIGSMFYASPKTLSAKREVLKAYARELIQTDRLANQDPNVIVAVAPKYLYKSDDPALIPFLVKAHIDAGIWPTDGGFAPPLVGRTMQFFVDNDLLKKGLTAEGIGDYTIVREVLAEIGK